MHQKIIGLYQLTKPGVLYGNVLTVMAGYFLAASGKIDILLLLAILFGSTFVIASACVLNNYLDQDIDRIMERTKKRPLIQGTIKGYEALILCATLGIGGSLILYFYTNTLTAMLGIVGFITYVFLYGALSKRLSIHGTLVGSISGAVPILMGYTAFADKIDAGAILVFAALFFWQMPEFYSISIYRLKEYKAAGIPVMSVVKGVKNTKIQIFIYTLLTSISILLLTSFGYTKGLYFIIMATLCSYWLWLGYKGLYAKNSEKWARKMFHFSLIILLAYSLMISIDFALPF